MIPEQVRDAELLLVRDAQGADVTALGVLLERYRLAVAPRVLGRPSNTEDAMLAALGRIQDLRDPAAIGPC